MLDYFCFLCDYSDMMFSDKRLKSMLLKSGLSEKSAELYLYVLNNEGCSIADACLDMNYGKSTVYRAFEDLKYLSLIESKNNLWKNCLKISSFSSLIKKLENDRTKMSRLISNLKSVELSKDFSFSHGSLSNYESLNEVETFERYLDLSKSKAWHNMLVFGNWEDFNNSNRNMVSLEKQFIKNRLKNGGKAYVVVTKHGPYTSQIIDYNQDLDNQEDRMSSSVDDISNKPIWINAFEGNNFLHIWNVNERKEITSTFLDSKPIADFYKDFIYSKVL